MALAHERPYADLSGRKLLRAVKRWKWLSVGITWALAVVAILPVLLHWTAPAPRRSASIVAVALAALAGALCCHHFYKMERGRLTASQSIGLQVLIAIEACIAVYLHHYLVDQTSGFSLPTNATWQLWVHNSVVRLDPGVLPHSYRFLPNSIVLWLQMGHVQFGVASQIYRVLSALVLFYALYRYARLHTSHRGALIAILLGGLVYPTSFVTYAGQLTDPLSHLSFVLAFIFLETEDFPFFLTTLLIGSLAKETVLALSGFYVLFCRGQKNYLAKAAMLCSATLAIFLSVRVFVLHGSMQYQQVSNVTLSHVHDNLYKTNWIPHFLMASCTLVPFLFLGWKSTPRSLKRMVLYLAPVLLISSLFFSWLLETRNFMPAVFVMAVIAGRYLDSQPSHADSAQRESSALIEG